MKILNGFAWMVFFAGLAGAGVAGAQQQPWSVRAANAAMNRWPNGVFSPAGAPPAWTHGQGLLLEGLEAVWKNTVDRQDFLYIEHSVDPLVGPEGELPWLKTNGGRVRAMQL